MTHSESGCHARDAFDGYRRTQWESKRREVAKLSVSVEPARLLGAGLVQVADSSSTADGYEWRRRESKAENPPASVREGAESRGVTPLGANPRERSRTCAVPRHGTAHGCPLPDLVDVVAGAIEATAATGGPGANLALPMWFIEAAARAVVRALGRLGDADGAAGEGGG